MPEPKPFRVAAVQAAPVFMDRAATVEKTCDLIQSCGREGAALAVFPESFIPGYPLWVWLIPAGQTRELREVYTELHAGSLVVPGPEVDRIGRAARAAGVAVAVGVSERNAEASDASLYNTLLYFGPDGKLLGKHRKLVPTGGERLVWAQGDGSDLAVHHLPFARVSGLICWENYMPLARYALSAWGVQVYVAPTWDRGEPWLSTTRHIAKELRVVVIGCCSAMRIEDIPDRFSFKKTYMQATTGWVNPGHSIIVDPDGKVMAGPATECETILYADVRPDQLVGPRWQLDIAGHYARPDVFELRVHREARPMIQEVFSPPAVRLSDAGIDGKK